jgi:hypothetical protein
MKPNTIWACIPWSPKSEGTCRGMLQSGPYLAILAVSVNILYMGNYDQILGITGGFSGYRVERLRSATLSRW